MQHSREPAVGILSSGWVGAVEGDAPQPELHQLPLLVQGGGELEEIIQLLGRRWRLSWSEAAPENNPRRRLLQNEEVVRDDGACGKRQSCPMSLKLTLYFTWLIVIAQKFVLGPQIIRIRLVFG